MSELINTDIYKIQEYVDGIKKKHIEEVEENTLLMSTFGYLGEGFSNEIQNALIVASEMSNEIFPIRAKFERSILTYAATSNITDINATPSWMNIQIGINEQDLLKNMNGDVFILDAKTPIMIENFEFHLDYNIRITKSLSTSGENNVYLAQYDMSEKNKLSDITRPYLLPPIRIILNNDTYIFISTIIRQVEYKNVYRKIISNDSIENKSFEFEYDSQLSYFDIMVKSGNNTVLIEPIYDGLPIEDETKKYCYYNYLNSNNIRIKFIKSSFEPKLNDEINVRIKTSQGEAGNFKYKDDILVTPESDIYIYNNLNMIVTPLSDADFGINRKSIDDLKRIIPKENLSRGNITSNADLQNYFNILDTQNNKMVFAKRIDNQNERIYYAYLLLKDIKNNVIPTNTVNLKLYETDFQDGSGSRLILKPGAVLKYDKNLDRCIKGSYTSLTELEQMELDGFVYTSPFLIVINKQPLSISYYLNIIDRMYYTTYSYINNLSFIQFITSTVTFKRQFLLDRNTYKLDISTVQNINEDKGLVTVTNGVINSKVKVFCVFHDKNGEALRYKEASILKYNDSTKALNFRVSMRTDDMISSDSSIKILDLMDIGTTNLSYVYLPPNCKVSIYIVAKFDKEYGRGDADLYIPGLQGYTLCNRYDIEPGIDFFVNYSEIISSKVSISKDIPEDTNYYYNINSIPVTKYSYSLDENRIKYFIDTIRQRKLYIDNALSVLEDSFGIDFKLFNTYGPSKIFKIGYNKEALNKTNISLKFRMKFDISAENNIKDFIMNEIKSYMENINQVDNLHISKLMTHLTNKYSSIDFIEFVGINNYDSSYQYIIRDDSKTNDVPEFLNINSKSINYMPDIIIDVIK